MTNQRVSHGTNVEARVTAFAIACLLAINVVQCNAATVYDVTKFKAKPDGKTDCAMPFIKAWAAACHAPGPAKVLIPKGKFVASEVVFAGPCSSPKPVTIEIQGTVMAYDDISSYPSGAWIMLQRVDGVVITGGGTINGRGQEAWQYSSQGGPLLPITLVFQTVQNTDMNSLNFVDSMGFHIKVTDSSNINISKLKIHAPASSPNTDGIHLSSNVNVNLTDLSIGTGDDCVSVGHGNHNILVARVTCGPGHGLSIGSLGKRPDETDLKGVTMINNTVVGTTNGVRIKTYRNSPKLTASSIYFEDIVMDRVRNPIIIDQNYASKKKKQASNVRLSDIHYRNIRGTTISPVAVSLNCSSTYPCVGIEMSNVELKPIGHTGALLSVCSNAKFSVLALKGINPGPAKCK